MPKYRVPLDISSISHAGHEYVVTDGIVDGGPELFAKLVEMEIPTELVKDEPISAIQPTKTIQTETTAETDNTPASSAKAKS